MIPADPGERGEEERGPRSSVDAALVTATKESSAVIGIAGAIGALGGFLIPLTFGAPWIEDPVSAVKIAFVVFTGFYVVCLAVTWSVYVRKVASPGRGLPSLAGATRLSDGIRRTAPTARCSAACGCLEAAGRRRRSRRGRSSRSTAGRCAARAGARPD